MGNHYQQNLLVLSFPKLKDKLLFREDATSAFADFMWVVYPGQIMAFENVCFCGGRKPRKSRKNPEQGENQQQTQPTSDTGPELNLWTFVVGEFSYHRAIPAPQINLHVILILLIIIIPLIRK